MFNKLLHLWNSGNRESRRHGEFNIQLFADGGSDGAAGAESGAGSGTPGDSGDDDNSENHSGGSGGEGKKDTGSQDDDDRRKVRYSDEDLDKIIGRKIAEERTKQDKAVKEAQRLANMTAEEKANEKAKELQSKYEALERKIALEDMAKVARGILSEKNINLPDGILSTLATEDADSTKANVGSFMKLFNKAVEDAVTERMKGKTPRTGAPANTMTKADIEKIKGRRERQEAIRNNMNLYLGGK